jgi:cell division protein FtsB
MPQFTLPNIQTGGQITVNAGDLASAQQAAASQTGVSLAAQQGGGTFGGNTFGGGATGAGNAPGVASPGNIASPDLSGLAAFAAQTSGVTQAQLSQQKQEFDAQLAFAQQQMQQLGIPQLQINQQLAKLQQDAFQSQLTLAQQAQQYNQAATTAGLTGYFTPPPAVPGVSQWTGQAGGGTPGGGAQGGTSWNQLSQQIQSQAGGSYNDAAAKSLFQQLTGAGANFNGGATVNLTPAQINQIMAAGGAPVSATAATATGPATTAGGAQQTLAGALQQANLTGQYQGAPTEAASEFARQLGLSQGQLGQQYLATASQLQGPQNTFQLSNYLRGAQGNPNVPTYLNSLANNIGMPAFQGQGSTAPTPASAAGLAGQLGGQQSATPGWDYNQTLGAIQNIMQGGAQSLKPGSLEGLTPDELQALGSGIGAAGGSLPSFLQQYQQSRVGQSATPQTPLA